MAKRRNSYSLPTVTLPRIPDAPRNPPGWNASELAVRRRNLPFAEDFKTPDPVGEVPPGMKAKFPGMTRPEWGVWIGLLQNNRVPDLDFVYRHILMGLGVSYYSTVDYMLPKENIALEVQGELWHYLESEREARDVERWVQLQNDGIHLVFLDEADCLARPKWVVQEALSLRDHSALATRRGLR